VGTGAAGLATAIFTKQLSSGRSVVLIDGAARPGAKILISGGGRCNVTNQLVTERDFWGGRPAVIRRVLRRFNVTQTTAFFAGLGVPLHVEESGKLFPDSNRARDVLEALLTAAARSAVDLRVATRVTLIERQEELLRLGTARGPILARTVVLATGGQSLPKSGSDGAGYDMARRLGHTIVPTTPALVPLTLAAGPRAVHQQLSGVSQHAELTLRLDRAVALRLRGSMLWTHFGISGPVVLDLSRHWLRARLEERDASVTLNMCHGEQFDAIDARWIALSRERPRALVSTALAGMIPAAVAEAMLDRLEMDRGMALAQWSRDARRRLSHALSEWPLEIEGSRGYSFAEATAGGVSLDEIDPATMASRRCPGLYLVGEVLDIDGRIGGFNFQWAWSSARVAAEALAGTQGSGTDTGARTSI
jgi:predicted Rossmann fold flavoprotein